MTRFSSDHCRSLLLIVALIALVAGPMAVSAQSPAPSSTAGNLYADIIPSQAQQIRLETGDQVPIYRVSADLVPASAEPARIEGHWQLSYINFTDADQDVIYLRMYPNFQDYGDGSMNLTNIAVDGRPAWTGSAAGPGADTSLVAISLPTPLAPRERAEVTLDFVTTIPNDAVTSYGMFGYFSDTRSYNLAQWMPLLAGWDPATGWLLDRPNTVGDPVFSNAAMFDIELTAPSDITFVTSGIETATEVQGPLTTHRWAAGPVRDFVMSAGMGLAVMEQQVGETIVRSWYFPGYEDAAAVVLHYAVDALDVFSRDFGAYPYREMDLIQTQLGGQAAGVEFPGLMYIGASHYDPASDYLEFTVVHEIAHQWWYGLVGNNQYLHAFLDEALANESSIIYKETVDGPDAATVWIQGFLQRPFLTMLFGPTGDNGGRSANRTFHHQRTVRPNRLWQGSAWIRHDPPHHRRRCVLPGVQARMFASIDSDRPARDLLAALETASGQDLHELWAHWFDRTEGRKTSPRRI